MENFENSRIVERYDQKKNQLFLEKFSRTLLENVLEYADGKVILDAGCGSGWAEPLLIEKGAKQIDAFDIDEDNIKCLQSRGIKNCVFEAKDFNKQNFKENYYDMVLSLEVVEHLSEYEFYLSNLAKALKKGGRLFLSTPNKKMSAGKNPYHLREFTRAEVVALLERNYFRVIKIRGLGTNELSKVWARLVPAKLAALVRASRLYKILVDKLVKFPDCKAEEAETMLFFSEKI